MRITMSLTGWGYAGLKETLETLRRAKIKSVGAGVNLEEAASPVVVEIEGKGRVIAFALGSATSGVPLGWAAAKNRPGVNLLEDLTNGRVQRVRESVNEVKREGDVVIVSIHWGGNWGYNIRKEEIDFAHHLIDEAGIDIVHGHSSHHVKGIEVYRDRLILYGCGDFLDDYEGIGGYEHYRADLSLMYFASVEPSTGKLVRVKMTPTQIKHFKVNRTSRDDALWLLQTLNREGRKFGTRVELDEENRLTLLWR